MDPLNPYPGNLKKHEVTSDPQAPYGKEEQRAPMLSDDGINTLAKKQHPTEREWGNESFASMLRDEYTMGCLVARDFYEAKITSGELVVAVPLQQARAGRPVWSCRSCGLFDTEVDYNSPPEECPGCGAKFVEE